MPGAGDSFALHVSWRGEAGVAPDPGKAADLSCEMQVEVEGVTRGGVGAPLVLLPAGTGTVFSCLHESVVLVDRTSRPRTIRKVPRGLLKALAKPTARDRRFRQCLSQLASLSKEARGCAPRLRLWRLGQGLQWFRKLKRSKSDA